MLTNGRTRGFVASMVLLAIVVSTTPVSAADFSTRSVIGSVSGVGPVALRGIAISQEGTLFPGDQVSVGAKGYAKVSLVNGHKLELDSMTKLTVVGSGQTAQLQVNSGNMAFVTKAGALDIAAGNFEITGDHNVSGNVAFVGNGFIGLRVKTGAVTVRNLTTKETTKVSAGQERLFSVQADNKTPLVQLASIALPDPIPSAPQAGGQGGAAKQPTGITRTGWVTIFATIGGAAAAIAVLATRDNNKTDVSGTLHQQSTLSTANQAAVTAGSAITTANQAVAAATQAAAAITAAPTSATLSATTKATLSAQAQSVVSSATTTAQQIATLQTQLASFQTQLAATTDAATVTSITASINGVIASLNADIANLNAAIASLNSLITTARADGVTSIPATTFLPIPPAPTASASIPL